MILAAALLLMCSAVDGDSGSCETIGRYRILDIDTPEIAGQCDAERELAARAKAYAVEFLREPVTIETDGRRDKYRRLLVYIRRGPRDLGAELVERGMARVWTGRREGWCNG